jgi:hypothetical protein
MLYPLIGINTITEATGQFMHKTCTARMTALSSAGIP